MATKVTMLAIVLSAVSVSCSLFHGPITEEKQCLPVGSGPCDLVKNLCCEGSRCNPLVHECLGTEDASQPAEETAARLEDPPAVDPEKETWPDPDRDAPPDGYVAMPSGFFHPECVHQWDQNVEMTDTADGTLVQYPNGSTVVLPPCPHAPFRRNSRPTAHEDAKDSPKSPVYYSGWIAYAGYTQPKEYSFMTSTWTVPPPPVKHLFINTIFFFNGMEEELHNSTVIIQPVLQFGRSGCGGGKYWSYAAYSVSGSGRAHCGHLYKTNPGSSIRGNMTKLSSGGWRVDAEDLTANTASTVTSKPANPLRFACLTLEGIVVYNCQAFPANSGVKFTNVQLADPSGDIKVPWTKYVIHKECGQEIDIEGTDVTIGYNTSFV